MEERMTKKVTIFGAGLVAKPMVDYLAGHGIDVIICDIDITKAEALAQPHPNVTPRVVNSNDESLVEALIAESDLAVSLLPAVMHPGIAKKCIKLGKHMVTASYISPAMRAMDAEAKAAGVTILNEIGVDPGIDHMSAMRVFDHVKDNGGTITSFMSYCGGLPAQDANTNPLGYKFSWAPKGVLIAAGNNATYLKDDEVIEVPGPELFSHYWLLDVPGAGTFEAYPNRNSLDYIDIYGLQGIHTMYRGTLRNVSHCDLWWVFGQMGFFKQEPVFENLSGTVRSFIATKMLNLESDENLEAEIATRYGLKETSVVLKKMGWLGFFDETPLPITSGGAIDVLTALMLDRMSYAPGERDLLVMHHEFEATYGDKKQRITSTMVDYGISNGDTSMARTVSLPAAIGVRLILEGQINRHGVIMPKYRDIYQPVLDELETLDIKLIERFYD
jgi:saccharopine dehydrogenase-like NADP-dependent oxidoreductase